MQLTNHPPPGHSPAFQLRVTTNETDEWREEKRSAGDDNSPIVEESVADERTNIRLVADEDELGGKERYLAEGFLNGTECETLINLARVRYNLLLASLIFFCIFLKRFLTVVSKVKM